MSLPLSHRLPNPPAVFVGREDAVSRLERALDRGPVALVVGPGGIGKSALVRFALHQGLADAPELPKPVVVVVEIRPGDGLVDALVTVGRLLDEDAESARWARAVASGEELLGEVLELAEARGATVVIEDLHHDAGDAQEILALLGGHASASRWVFTSRRSVNLPQLAEQMVVLGPLDEAASRTLAERCGASGDTLDQVVRMAAGSPLAVRQGVSGSGRMAELDGLPTGVVDLLRTLASIRRPLQLSTLSALVAMPDEGTLSSLEDAGWLTRSPRAEGTTARMHDVLREALEGQRTPEEHAAETARVATKLAAGSVPVDEGAVVEALGAALSAGMGEQALSLLRGHGERLLSGGRGLWLWRMLASPQDELLPWALRSAAVVASPETLAWASQQPQPKAPDALIPWLEALIMYGHYDEVIAATADVDSLPEPYREAVRVKRARTWLNMGLVKESRELFESFECVHEVNAAEKEAYWSKALMLSGDYQRATAVMRALQPRVERLPPLVRDTIDVERSQVVVALGGQRETEPLFGLGSVGPKQRRRAHLMSALNSLLAGRRDEAETALDSVTDVGAPFDLSVRHMLKGAVAVLDGRPDEASAAMDIGLEVCANAKIWALYPWGASIRLLLSRLIDAKWPDPPLTSPVPRPLLLSQVDAIHHYITALEETPRAEWPERPEPPQSVTQQSLVATFVELGWSRARYMAGDPDEADLFCATASRRAAESGWTMLHAGALMSRLPIVAELKRREAIGSTVSELAVIAERVNCQIFVDWAELWRLVGRAVPQVEALTKLATTATVPARTVARALMGGPTPNRLFAQRSVESVQQLWHGVTLRRVESVGASWERTWILDLVGKRVVSPEGQSLNLARQHIGLRILTTVARSEEPVSKEDMALAVWELGEYHPLRDDNRLHVSVNRLRKALGKLPGAEELLSTSAEGYLIGGREAVVVVIPPEGEEAGA